MAEEKKGTKSKISVTIDKETADQIDSYFREQLVLAAKSGEPIPNLSNVYEAIIKAGWDVKRKEKRK